MKAKTKKPRNHKATYAGARAGRHQIGGYFSPAVQHELHLMAADHSTSIQGLLTESLNLLFKKHGRPQIA